MIPLKEKCRTAMLHNYMNLYSLMMYAQSMRSPNLVEFLEIYKGVDPMSKTNLG